MAFETGTATDHTDLWNKLISFLTTNADLVAASQEWTQVWSDSSGFDQRVLRGPGLAAQDQVFVGLRLYEDIPSDHYNIQMYGMTDIIGSVTQLEDHVNVSNGVRVFADDTPMRYWFTANGRRFTITTQISTVYSSGYAGLLLPFALPTSYPYPLFIGGSASVDPDSGVDDWRSTSSNHSNYLQARRQDFNPVIESAAQLLDPAGAWLTVIANSNDSPDEYTDHVVTYPYGGTGNLNFSQTSTQNFRPWIVLENTRELLGGDSILMPIILQVETPTPQVYGQLDGVLAVSGLNNAAENIITKNAVDHVVIQNAFRTAGDSYHVIALE